MKINCNQFENLFSFYLNGDLSVPMKEAFEQHLRECHQCCVKFDILKNIIGDIKEAYNKFIAEEDYFETEVVTQEYVTGSELSAYIDNELSDENSVKIRRNIIAKPKVREKIDKLYKLRKIMSDSFAEQKKRLKTDFAKDIVGQMNKQNFRNNAYVHCIAFILFVVTVFVFSIWILFHCV